jgi:hypothetical protein
MEKSMKKHQLIIMTLAGVFVIGSFEEMGKNDHGHEEPYQATRIVQECAPFLTGSYVPGLMSR